MSHQDWLDSRDGIYKDFTFDEKERKWNARILSYGGSKVVHKTDGHRDEEAAREAIEPIFIDFIKELSNGRKIEDLPSV